ncbi:hypothetical protein MRS76_07945 [Rhizobiaceae bacterium n13]|uniref:Uncharacterized protein n=1 Tax=Ferirhizobium litorale TaxID=2927786 RepID=A0AAE3QDX2_9HYPH|nr:hypothetical protein [Fererhizobium litorale]MDI7861888.1 hypothetical protein [Fererhizobium litorale]MDI7921770.1 hypothetical protein [Fererhizobium litorale]
MHETTMQEKIRQICSSASLTKDRKIKELQTLEQEARAIQRAATESPMAEDDGWQNDLRLIEKALLDLGAGERETGAATL